MTNGLYLLYTYYVYINIRKMSTQRRKEMYDPEEDERKKYARSNWNNLSTREVVSGLMEGKMPITRNKYDVNKGMSQTYYLDGKGNERDRPIWEQTEQSRVPTTNMTNINSGNGNMGTTQAMGGNQLGQTGANSFAGNANNNSNSVLAAQNKPAMSGGTAPAQPDNSNSMFNNVLRKGEQLASAGLNGLTLGFNDEIEGFFGGLGYGMANLGMKGLNKLGFDVKAPQESAWEAAQRGYVKARDERREALNNGRQEMPIASAVMEGIGAIASNPYSRVFAASKTAPLAIKAARNGYAAAANGVTYGVGNTEKNDPLEYANNVVWNGLGAVGGNKIGNLVYGRGDHSQLGRGLINEITNQSMGVLKDALDFEKPEEDDEDEEEKQRRQRNGMGYY